MKTETAARSLQKPILYTAGWLLLAITVAQFGFMASAHAQTQAPADRAMSALSV